MFWTGEFWNWWFFFWLEAALSACDLENAVDVVKIAKIHVLDKMLILLYEPCQKNALILHKIKRVYKKFKKMYNKEWKSVILYTIIIHE